MYTSYFGLSEIPFSITPDPRYLYMSQRHREAMAHLLFGIQEGGGFVQLTGEVGTGKTTLCRCVLEQLPENVDVALILNPNVTEHELLAGICDELKIRYPKRGSTKDLLDSLNGHLLDVHAQDRRTVLIIDEAQNLSKEVLEQVRLLTNLETPKQKLLRIVLIGQPELIDALNRPDLRQLAQRITARYHLGPLSAIETAEYVKHRLAVAGCKQPLFRRAAIRKIYKASGGVPRLINVICDRALLGAYSQSKTIVTGRLAKEAAAEVFGTLSNNTLSNKWSVRTAVWVPLLLLAVSAPFLWKFSTHITDLLPSRIEASINDSVPMPSVLPGNFHVTADVSDDAPPDESSDETTETVAVVAAENVEPEDEASEGIAETVAVAAVEDVEPEDEVSEGIAETVAVVAAENVEPEDEASEGIAETAAATAVAYMEPPSLGELLAAQRLDTDLVTAVKRLAELRGFTLRVLATDTVCEDTQRIGLKCVEGTGTWRNLLSYNRAAILTLHDTSGHPHYAVLTAIEDDHAVLSLAEEQVRFPLVVVNEYWYGDYMLLWRPPALQAQLVAKGSVGKDVIWLRRAMDLLSLANGTPPLSHSDGDVFDDELLERVLRFQRQHVLEDDGIVGEKTLMHINAALYPDAIPLLVN